VREVANKFFDATKNNDLELYKSIINKEGLAKVGPLTEKKLAKYQADYKELNYEITRVTIMGDQAKVSIKINYVTNEKKPTEGSADDEIEMVKEEGVWKLVAVF